MRKGSKTYAAFHLAPLAMCLVAGLATSCGKKDKSSDDDGPAAAPDTYVVDSSIEGGSVKLKYKSTDLNAKYKCKLEAEGQTAEWQDCPTEGMTLPIQPGVRYTFQVKAIGASGVEDAEPARYVFVGGGSTSTEGSAGPQTLILNRDDVGETYGQTELALEFGVKDGPSVDDVRFECKRENETSFRRCPDDSSYFFKEMKDGYIYSLTVRAVNRDDGSIAKEDRLTFRVELEGLDIGGADDLATKTTGSVTMTYPAGAQCSVDGEQAVPCVPTFAKINLSDTRIPQGNHTLVVTVNGSGREELSFCARVCSGDGARPAAPVVTDFQLGSFYTYRIPKGMHVVNYATSKTTGGSVYWLRAIDDPMSNDLDACLSDGMPHPVPGREFSMLAHPDSPTAYKYCGTTPTRETYKIKTEHMRALNHLEVSSDIEELNNPETGTNRDERVVFNVFDNDVEFMVNQTTFQRLCINRNGRIFSTHPIRFISKDYYGEATRASLMICLADLVEFINGVPVSARWWIGSFFISSDMLELPAIECIQPGHPGYDALLCDDYWGRRQRKVFENSCKNPSLIEATLMVRQDTRLGQHPRSTISDEVDFARMAQRYFMDNLGELVPVD